ncbi:MAG: nucleotidyltransferase [Oscillospiraceae bacterium]|nr:nucleotidyltransferase [Oscillospiraceae bacterium]
MKKPVLIVMAAGMGSRYGGLKQIDPVGPNGEVILDYSVYDAKRAGFEEVVFIIKHAIEKDFKEVVGARLEKQLKVHYAFQELDDLPEGYAVPEGRIKPWGTSHAIRAARDIVDGPFAVINADDYYGPEAFQVVYDYLTSTQDDEKYRYAMVGYFVKNTVTDAGTVARGVCEYDENGFLTTVVERTKIEKVGENARFTEDDGASWTDLAGDTLVSMNFWGFSRSMIDEIDSRLPAFLDKAMETNPMKGEYLLPGTVNELLGEGKATVKVLYSRDKWYGVTYKEDRPGVVAALQSKHDEGLYPTPMWK